MGKSSLSGYTIYIYTCDYLRLRDLMLFDQDIIVLFR